MKKYLPIIIAIILMAGAVGVALYKNAQNQRSCYNDYSTVSSIQPSNVTSLVGLYGDVKTNGTTCPNLFHPVNVGQSYIAFNAGPIPVFMTDDQGTVKIRAWEYTMVSPKHGDPTFSPAAEGQSTIFLVNSSDSKAAEEGMCAVTKGAAWCPSLVSPTPEPLVGQRFSFEKDDTLVVYVKNDKDPKKVDVMVLEMQSTKMNYDELPGASNGNLVKALVYHHENWTYDAAMQDAVSKACTQLGPFDLYFPINTPKGPATDLRHEYCK